MFEPGYCGKVAHAAFLKWIYDSSPNVFWAFTDSIAFIETKIPHSQTWDFILEDK